MRGFVPDAEIDAALDIPATRVISRVGHDIREDAVRFCPVDTGALVESISEFKTRPDGLSGWVEVGTDHWAPTEYGSRAHYIVSHGTWSLHNAETGEYFGTHVWHPGTPMQAFMRPALYQHRDLKGI